MISIVLLITSSFIWFGFAAHRLNNRYGKLQIGNLARVKATQLRQWDIVHETRSIDEQTSFDYIPY